LRRFIALGRIGGEKMMANQHPDKRIREEIAGAARRLWNNDNERFVGSVIATLNSYLRIYSFPAVGRATARSDFRLSDLQCADKPLTVYQIVRPSYAELLQPLMRMQMTGAQKCLMHDRFVSMDGRRKRHELLYLREEFTSEGHVARMEKIMTDMRGYFQRALIVVQGFGALTKVYGDENHFFNNSIQATLQPRSIREKKYIETALGEHEVVKSTTSKSRIGSIFTQKPGSTSVSKSSAVRPVMRTGEMARKLKGKVLLLNTEEPYLLEQLTAQFDKRYAPLMSDSAPEMRDEDGELIYAPPDCSNPWFDIDHSGGKQLEAVTPPEPETGDAAVETQPSAETEDEEETEPMDWPVEMPDDDQDGTDRMPDDNDDDTASELQQPVRRRRLSNRPKLITHDELASARNDRGTGTWVR
jgi:type IV secretion system protein VirD4